MIDRHLVPLEEVQVRITSRTMVLFREGRKLRFGDVFAAYPNEVASRLASGELEVVDDVRDPR